MKEPRILMVLDSFQIGGTETHVLSLVKEFKRLGIYVCLAGSKGKLLQRFRAVGCPIYTIDFPLSLKSDPVIEHNLKTILRKEKITIVHAHQTPSAYLTFQVAKKIGISTVFTVHGSYYPDSELRKVIEKTDYIISVSPPIVKKLQTYNLANMSLIANGINSEEFIKKDTRLIRNRLNISIHDRTVVYASRITWEKATKCMMLMKACKDLKLKYIPNLKLVIVGNGNQLSKIQKLANHINQMCKDQLIHIVGEQEDMSLYYSLGDIVIGTGRIALEAMSCERPIIAVGNHGYFGPVNEQNFFEAWDYYFGDHQSRTICSRFILANDINQFFQKRDKLEGKQLRKLVNENFNISKKAQELIEIYQKL